MKINHNKNKKTNEFIHSNIKIHNKITMEPNLETQPSMKFKIKIKEENAERERTKLGPLKGS